MSTRTRFDAADFCMALACTPEDQWPALIGDSRRKQEIADYFLSVAREAPKPSPEQLAVVRAVFRRPRPLQLDDEKRR
jgi:hypothetical protein